MTSVAAFGAAAERSREGGMDGVEILAAFGFLVAVFLSPVANRRADRYGGSLGNRMRFCREVVAAVRDAVGRDRIVGLRVPGDELIEGGLQLEEMKDVARALESDGKLDYLNVIAGTNMDRLLRAEHWPPTPARHGLFVHLAAGARPGPVSVAGAAEHGVSVCAAHDVLDSESVPAAPSLVWDRAGGGAAVSAAEHLAVAGCRVALVTPSMAVADDVDITNRVPLYRRLYEHGVTMLPNSDVARIDAQGVVVRNVYTGRETTVPGIERMVVGDAAEASDEIADALREEGLRVLTAGDCVSPREVDVAMAEGALAAREI